MYWPNFEYHPLKPDVWLKNKRTGERVEAYTLKSWAKYYGQIMFKEIVQDYPDDLEEGPRPSDGH